MSRWGRGGMVGVGRAMWEHATMVRILDEIEAEHPEHKSEPVRVNGKVLLPKDVCRKCVREASSS